MVSGSEICCGPAGCLVDKGMKYGMSGMMYGAGRNEVRKIQNDVRVAGSEVRRMSKMGAGLFWT